METFGQKMAQAVASRGVKLEEVARATRAELRDLEALINGEYTALPDEDRVADLLRSFAQYVEVDGDAVIRDYLLDRHGTLPAELPRRRRRAVVPILLAVVVAFVLAGWWWLRSPEPPERTARVATASLQMAPPPPPAPVQVEQRSEPQREPLAVAPGRWTVEEYGVGTGVVQRAIVGESDRFDEGTEVWFWTRITGAKPGDTIHHVWLHEGQIVNDVALRIGGSPWRTHSKKTLLAGSVGRWAVEVQDDAGRVAVRREFDCDPAPSN